MIETYKVLPGIYDTSVSPEIPIISEYDTSLQIYYQNNDMGTEALSLRP